MTKTYRGRPLGYRAKAPRDPERLMLFRKLRKKGYTKAQIARRFGVSKQSVGKYLARWETYR